MKSVIQIRTYFLLILLLSTLTSTPLDSFILTNEERKWIQEHPEIKVAVDPHWAPIEFRDRDGIFKGLSIEYLQEIEKLSGLNFEIVDDMSWSQLIEAGKNKELDLFSCVSRTEEREKYLLFTEPYLNFPIDIFTNLDVTFVRDIKDLKDKKVGVVRGYAIEEWLRSNYPEIIIVPVESIKDGMNALLQNQIFAFAGNLVTTGYYLSQNQITGVKVSGNTPFENIQAIAVRDDWPQLRDIIQKCLHAIPEETKHTIDQHWMTPINYQESFDYSLLWKIMLPMGFAVFMLLVRNRRIAREIEKQKHYEKKLQKAIDAAEESNRAKSSFLANMSHEIRTPMNSILGYLKLSIDSHKLPHDIEENLITAHNSAEALLVIINDILDLSKIEAGKLEISSHIFQLPEFLTMTIKSLNATASQKGLKLHLSLPEKPPKCIKGDSHRLQQVLINLIGNAIKFTETGSVTVTFRDYDDSFYLFSVSDTGIGMSQEQISKVFNSFTQADNTTARRYGGSGLGTTISKELVAMWGGKIWVESEPRAGSTFYFTFPKITIDCKTECDKSCRFSHQQLPTKETNADPTGYRILVAEDLEPNARLVNIRLERAGYEVHWVKDGLEAVESYKSNYYDIILMDVHMPVMDGIEATKQIRKIEEESGGHIPIIALTASLMEEDTNACQLVGMDTMVGKPIQFDILLNTIKEFIQ